MSEQNNGGPAFPVAYGDGRIEGMYLRDYFAAKAMHAALVTASGPEISFIIDEAARLAYKVADAMLRAREAS